MFLTILRQPYMNRFSQSVSERFEKHIFLNGVKIVFENLLKPFRKKFFESLIEYIPETILKTWVGPDLVFLAGCRMSGACQIHPDMMDILLDNLAKSKIQPDNPALLDIQPKTTKNLIGTLHE